MDVNFRDVAHMVAATQKIASQGKTYENPSANMECPITWYGFCNLFIVARRGGLKTTNAVGDLAGAGIQLKFRKTPILTTSEQSAFWKWTRKRSEKN